MLLQGRCRARDGHAIVRLCQQCQHLDFLVFVADSGGGVHQGAAFAVQKAAQHIMHHIVRASLTGVTVPGQTGAAGGPGLPHGMDDLVAIISVDQRDKKRCRLRAVVHKC